MKLKATLPMRFAAVVGLLPPLLHAAPPDRALDADLPTLKTTVRDVRPAVQANQITFEPGVEVEVQRSGDEFLGLGRISIDGVVVRTGRTPMTLHAIGDVVQPSVLTGVPTPPLHETLKLVDVRLHGDGLGADVILEGHAWQRKPDRVIIKLRGHVEDWRGARSAGFSYQFSFVGRDHRVHQLRESSSWSLDGTVNDRLSIDQNEAYGKQSWAEVFAPQTTIKSWSFPAARGAPESRFAVGDFMDFLGAANVSFVRFLQAPALTYKDLSRQSSDDEISTQEWYPTKASRDFKTMPMHVRLYHAGGVNAWLDARGILRERYAKDSGIEATPLVPTVINNLASMTTGAFGKEYDNVADPVPYIDWLADLGIRRMWIWSRWKTAWTAWDKLSPEERDAAKEGLSHAVMTMEFDDAVIDLERLEKLVTYGNSKQVESMLWIPGGHLSRVSPLRKNNPSWVVKQIGGQPFTYVYTDLGGNWYPAGYGNYLFSSLMKARQQIPFTGVWCDSFQVFGLDVIDYGRSGWPNQFDAAVDFVRRCRTSGFSVGVECALPLAMPSSTGFYRTEELAGKEFLGYGVAQHFGGAEPKVSPELYFKLLAWDGPPLLLDRHWKENEELQKAGRYANKAYAALKPRMFRPRLLPDGAGVLWLDTLDQPAALFAFRDSEVDLGGRVSSANDAVSGEAVALEAGKLSGTALRTYRLTPVDDARK